MSLVYPFALWANGATTPNQTVNEALWTLEAVASGRALSSTTAAQPGSPATGDTYLLPATPSGADWGAFAHGDVVTWTGANWFQLPARRDVLWHVRDSGELVYWDGTDYVEFSAGGAMSNPMTTENDIIVGGTAGAPTRFPATTAGLALLDDADAAAQRTTMGAQKRATIVAISDASDDLEASWDGDYIRMTNTGAKTLNVRADATHALPTAGQWHIRNAGATGDITITPAGGVTITAPAGGTLVLEPGMTVTLFRTGTDAFDLIGQTVPA